MIQSAAVRGTRETAVVHAVAASASGHLTRETPALPGVFRVRAQRAQARQSVAGSAHCATRLQRPWNPIRASGEGFGGFGPLAPGFGRLERPLGYGTSSGRAPDMHEETDQHGSDNEKLLTQHVRSHDGVSFHDRILLANLHQSSRSTLSWGSFLNFFAFKEGMLGTPISVLGGWPTVSDRERR